jgi:hypothetical protein
VKWRWEFRPEFVMHLLRERLHHLIGSVGLVTRVCAVNSREDREILSSVQLADRPGDSPSLLFAVIRWLSWANVATRVLLPCMESVQTVVSCGFWPQCSRSLRRPRRVPVHSSLIWCQDYKRVEPYLHWPTRLCC